MYTLFILVYCTGSKVFSMMSQSCYFYLLSTCRSYVRVILYLPTHLNITVEIFDNILPSEPREGAKLTAWWHLLKGILNTIMFRCHICHYALTITILLVLLHITCIINPYRILAVHESVVSPVSKRYMRAGIGNERLLVCLSEYLPWRIVNRISSMSTIE